MFKLARVAIMWIVLAAVYMFLAGSVNPFELGAAAVCASAAAALFIALSNGNGPRFRLALPLGMLGTAVRSLATDTFAVGASLLRTCMGRPVASAFAQQPFASGGDTAADHGRRAAVVLAISLAPRSYVVREGERALLLHTWPARPTASGDQGSA